MRRSGQIKIPNFFFWSKVILSHFFSKFSKKLAQKEKALIISENSEYSIDSWIPISFLIFQNSHKEALSLNPQQKPSP